MLRKIQTQLFVKIWSNSFNSSMTESGNLLTYRALLHFAVHSPCSYCASTLASSCLIIPGTEYLPLERDSAMEKPCVSTS